MEISGTVCSMCDQEPVTHVTNMFVILLLKLLQATVITFGECCHRRTLRTSLLPSWQSPSSHEPWSQQCTHGP